MAVASECSMRKIYCINCMSISWINVEMLEVYCMICVCATITCVVKSSLMFTFIIEHARVIAETDHHC